MDKPKILICSYACLGDPDERFKASGEGLLGWALCKELAKSNNIHVLTYSKNRNLVESALQRDGIKNIKFYYFALPRFLNFLQKIPGGVQIYAYFWQIKAYFVAQKMNKEIKFDIFHHLTYANDWMASHIGAFLPIPYIRGPGGGAHRVPKEFLKDYLLKQRFGQIIRSVGQWIFRHDPFFIISQNKAKVILVCNKEAFEALPKKWQAKAEFFPVNGILEEDFNLPVSKNIQGEFSVITAGKFIKIKNFSLAIKAFKIFSDKFPRSQFIIVGDGPEFLNFKNITENLGIIQKVIFKKWMAREALLAEIANSDIFIFPSLRDGGGQVVIEAMSQGKPIICFDIAGPGFHIDESCGIKIKPESRERAVNDMAEALEKLYLNKKLREELGRKARQKAESEYSWEKLGQKMQKIYNKILG